MGGAHCSWAIAAQGARSGRSLTFVAYDEELADRIRELLAGRPDVTEKKMFGGLAFLIGRHMAISASGQGGALVRVDPEATSSLVARGAAEVAVMRDRPMEGWLRVPNESLRTKRQLERWVHRATTYVETLPPKEPARRR